MRLRLRSHSREPTRAWRWPSARTWIPPWGRWTWCPRIRDNGTGIPRKLQDKIFNPFFTTKPTGSGTGLGLSITYDIVVRRHRGELRLQSTEGHFTECLIILPQPRVSA